EAGFQILFECIDDHQKCMKFAPFEIDGFKYGEVAGMGKDARYLFARINAPDGDILVSVHTAVAGGSTSYTLFQVVEKKTMDTGKVQVDIDAEKMAEDIDKKGSVSIYGILFDTDKAKIKEKSESTMTEIASLLEQKSDLRLYIVGHTDATGSLEYNMNLSRKRAKAVVNYLTSKHEIRQERLIPRGVGPLAPVASNETEEGRARNRRVELVKMPEQ
ncbi:MAG: OmpA family protein, partial [Desulfobacteraceae bacterium]|nr:OmpA family protein [Desulfobacteraceae bacterium]